MKRKNGEGTWGTKNIKGTTYKFFRNSSGKYFYGKTQKEIKEKIKKYEESIAVGTQTSDDLFLDYLKNWLYNIKQPQVKRRTFDGYEEYFNNLIVNYKDYSLTDLQLSKLTSEHITKYYNSLSAKYSLATIKKIHTILNQCLEYAVDEELIVQNPMRKVVLPSEDVVAKPKKEIPFLSIKDMEKLYQESNRVQEAGFKINGQAGDFVYGNNAKIIVLIMYTGLRISEALGLKWMDVNFDENYISVNRNLSRVKDRSNDENNYIYVETTLKKSASKRTIPLCDRALEVLLYLKEHNKSTKDTDYVCMSKTGNIAGMRNINRTLNAMLVRANCDVQQCGMHSLRHSFGSYLVSQNVDISVVSRLLGHKNIVITYKVYIHVLKQSQIDAIKLFNPNIDEEASVIEIKDGDEL